MSFWIFSRYFFSFFKKKLNHFCQRKKKFGCGKLKRNLKLFHGVSCGRGSNLHGFFFCSSCTFFYPLQFLHPFLTTLDISPLFSRLSQCTLFPSSSSFFFHWILFHVATCLPQQCVFSHVTIGHKFFNLENCNLFSCLLGRRRQVCFRSCVYSVVVFLIQNSSTVRVCVYSADLSKRILRIKESITHQPWSAFLLIQPQWRIIRRKIICSTLFCARLSPVYLRFYHI